MKITDYKDFINMLNNNQITYCILNNHIEFEELKIFINLKDNNKFIELMENNSFRRIGSNTDKFTFIYRLYPDIFWTSPNNLKIYSSCQMSCTSMSNLSNCKLPVDKKIQNSLWENKFWNSREEYWEVSKEDGFIYEVIDCIFNKKTFDDASINWFNTCNINYDSPSLHEKMNGVFFFFTPYLLDYIRFGNFKDIIHNYRTFHNY